jgi:hypothetical protein
VVQSLDAMGTVAGVPVARRFVRQALLDLGLDDLVGTAELLVSELATNVVLHARTDYRVEVEVVGDALRVSVLDRSPVLVHRRVNRLDAGTGRGLGLVEALALRWGPVASEDLGGHAKGIWFELPTDAALLPEVTEGGLYGEDWLAMAEDL